MAQVLAPQLQQSLALLQAPTLELKALVEQELQQNPVLEEVQDFDMDQEGRVREPKESQNESVDPSEPPEDVKFDPATEKASNEPVDDFQVEFEKLTQLDQEWRDHFAQTNVPMRRSPDDEEKRQFMFDSLVAETSLQEYLLDQLRLSELADAQQPIAEMIIGNIDDYGRLRASIDELAFSTNIPAEQIIEVLKVIQAFHPPGVAARDLRECLLLQLERAGRTDSVEYRIVRDHMEALSKRRLPEIARGVGLTVEQVQQAVERIGHLDPRPGRAFSADNQQYIVPEVFILDASVVPTKELADQIQFQLISHLIANDQAALELASCGNLNDEQRLTVNQCFSCLESGQDGGMRLKAGFNYREATDKLRQLTGHARLSERQKSTVRQWISILELTEDAVTSLKVQFDYDAALKALRQLTEASSLSQAQKQIVNGCIARVVGNELTVATNDEQIPHLRISNIYKDLMSKGDSSQEVRDYIRDKIRAGKFLIKSLHQRQQTILNIAKEIVKRQRGFLEQGMTHLRPMTMVQIAEVVGVHETTVSRAVSGKYMETPQGIYEMKFFFTSGVKTADGTGMSNTSVKEVINELVKHEDGASPLSDEQLVKILAEKNIFIARRTVAKYRSELNILPSNLRRVY